METAIVVLLVLLFFVIAVRGGDGLQPWILAGLGIFFFLTAALDRGSAYASIFFGLLAFTVALPGWWSVGLAIGLTGYTVVGAFVVEEGLLVEVLMILLAASLVQAQWRRKTGEDRFSVTSNGA